MLIDEFMPAWDARSQHETMVAAPAVRTWEAVLALDLGNSRVIRVLLSLRGVPALFRKGGALRSYTLADLERAGFISLGQRPGQELVLGLVGQFWKPFGSVRRDVAAGDFAQFFEPGWAKTTWNFTVASVGAGSLLATETRIRTTDATARQHFARYWKVVGPFSGLIRRRTLRLIRKDAEDR